MGAEQAREKLGVNSTGLPFNSLSAIERSHDGRTNPMVNAGAIATTSLVPGATVDAKWRFIHDGLSRFAGRTLPLNEEVYASASETNYRNQSIARLLQSYERIYFDPAQATDLYTRQCSLNVSAKDLAVMGATLADGGVNPLTKERVVDPAACHFALAVMATAGLYETSGDWLYDIGLPGKSGIGGGIVTVSPGKGGLGTFAPPLDKAGNSVKGQLVAKFLSQRLGMDLFVSQPLPSELATGEFSSAHRSASQRHDLDRHLHPVEGVRGPLPRPEIGEAFSCSRATATETCSLPTILSLVGSKPCQPAPGM